MKQRILLIDNNLSELKKTASALEVNRFTVMKAGDVNLAMNIISYIKPDLILINIDTSIKNISEFCRGIRMDRNLDPIKVIAFSTQESNNHKNGIRVDEFDGFICHPASSIYFLAELRELLNCPMVSVYE
jgi:DNA-binding response OmpR family regulator